MSDAAILHALPPGNETVKRSWQIFVAPGAETEPLPLVGSPWHDERWVTIPREHWHLILDFADHLDAEKTEKLRSFSYAADGNSSDHIRASPEELESSLQFLDALANEIGRSPPLVPEATEEVPDEYVNEEHVRMLSAVGTVLRESLRLQQPFRAWVE